MGSGFSKKKKQAKMLQEQFSKLQSELQNQEVTGTSGNGLVTVSMTGDGDLKQIKIKPECVDPEDVEGLEVLIKAAFLDAAEKSKAQTQGLPGMQGMPGLPQGFPSLGNFGL